MLKKRIIKIAFVLTCIITLLAPYSTVFATLTHEDTTARLQSVIMHEGGEEASGTLTEAQKNLYDTAPHGYTIGNTLICKVIEEEDKNYTNTFYCLNAKKSFPGATAEGYTSLEYKNVADFTDSTNPEVKSLHLSTSVTENEALWTENYRALEWIFNNSYLRKQTPEQKDIYLENAFKDSEYDLEVVKATLTDDDIDVIQQQAIWYFTNRDSDDYNVTTLPAVRLSGLDLESMEEYEDCSYYDVTGNGLRQPIADWLYGYLIRAAQERTDTISGGTYPSVAETNAVASETETDFVVGPFKVNAGTVSSTEYTIKLLDQANREISRTEYQILIEGEENFTDKNISDILNQNYYIYLPKTNTTITNMQLELTYSTYETKATVWKNKTTNEQGVEVYQPLVLLTRPNTPHKVVVPVEIKRASADLALRKYIISVTKANGEKPDIGDRTPEVDVTKLKDGRAKTADYKHAKNPVLVSAGDTVVYEIRVYNEGDVDATGTIVVDALPTGLEFVEDSEINETYKWQKLSYGQNVTVYTTDYLKDKTINKFDKENGTELDSAYVQIECKIANGVSAASVLTNVAEISEDGIFDIDSEPANNDYTQKDYDASKYTGDNNNKEDLSDSDYFYRGREDDDDFEKVQIEGKAFDLNLKKFITKINGKSVEPSREPEVDVSKLRAGTSTDATYTLSKTPLVVEQGDIITYTIRVYNEGELDGYAEEVADYIPEGLGFLVNYNDNIDNYWAIPKENLKTVKLNTIPNGKSHLSVNDFNDIENLDEVDVVVGKAELTSTKLKSSETDTNNLLKAFDKENSTTLDYKDIEVTCIVLTDTASGYNLRNIGEITKDLDENKNEVDDRDSTPDTVNPDNYPGGDNNQDDNDYENLTTKEPEVFDLSLQKFITGINGGKVEGREPKISINSKGEVSFSSTTSPLQVQNNDVIIYTIRVYNEGSVAGYAKEISDDLPAGLEFLKDNDVNQKYGWKLYDKNGNETSDLNQAVSVKTDYLSKAKSEERNEDNLLDAFDGKNLDYRDVQIAFKIVEPAVKGTQRIIKNIAEITDDEDQNGNPVEDKDSTPGNNKPGEDDIDDEQVYVKYFDLSLQKDLVKIIITEDGTTREISLTSADGLQKVEIHRKKIDTTTVKFVYDITVKNEGEIAGYATEITDYIPEGLEFIQEENKVWTQVSQNVITTSALSDTRLEPGQTASVQVVLKWINNENNLNLKTNTAEISKDKNDSNTPDIDSTPGNKVTGEDDIDSADVFLGISTGTAPTYIALTAFILTIMATGVTLIKKYVL